MVKQEERRRTAEFLLHSRAISAEHLPIGHSFIPYDLLLQVYLHAISEMREQLNIKSLFASLPYSDMGMRYHLRRLIDNGWIKIDTNGSDPRMRSVTPTSKTFVKFDAISLDLLAKIHPT